MTRGRTHTRRSHRIALAVAIAAAGVAVWISQRSSEGARRLHEDPVEPPVPVAAAPEAPHPAPALAERKLDLRLVAVTHSPDDPSLSRATIREELQLLFLVLGEGDALSGYENLSVVRIEPDRLLDDAGRSVVLVLDRSTPLVLRKREPTREDLEVSMREMKALAERGLLREGSLMASWGRIGYRDNAALLSQGRLAPYWGERGPDGKLPKQMQGLEVIRFECGSFWDQLGLQVGDIM